MLFCFFFQAEDGIRDLTVTGVQTCALPICARVMPLQLPQLLSAFLTLVLYQPDGLVLWGIILWRWIRLIIVGIGRGSGWGRGEISGVGVSLKKKKKKL